MKLLLFTACILFLFSCGSDKRTNYTTEDENGNKIMTKESHQIMDDLLVEFLHCKSSKENVRECKYFTAKAICDFYEIDDFKKGDTYVNYEEMHDIILGKLGTWRLIGKALDQKNLDEAQRTANNGQATVAISSKSKYGHVAIIVPGTQQKAGKWNKLNVPLCASFFMVSRPDSFIEKHLGYAWKTGEEVYLYTKIPE